MKKEMLINVLEAEECRIAIIEEGVLEELYVERASHESYVGHIYKGRVVNIEPSIQAAFIDFGVGRNGFLHVSDVEPSYYRHLLQDGQPRGQRDQQSRRGRQNKKTEDRRPRPEGRRTDRQPRTRREEEPANTPSVWLEDPYEFGTARIDQEVPATQEQDQPEVLDEPAVSSSLEALPEVGREEAAELAPLEPGHENQDDVSAEPSGEELEAGEPVKEETTEPPPRKRTKGKKLQTEGRRKKTEGKKERGKSKKQETGPSPEEAENLSPAEVSDEQSAKDEEQSSPAVEDPGPNDLPPKPQLMDSAERRTDEEDDPDAEFADESSEDSTAASSSDDIDLFFPPPAAPRPEPAVPEKEPEVEEPAWESPETDQEEVEDAYDPPFERSRGRGGKRRFRNIEDQLEEDLQAVETDESVEGSIVDRAEDLEPSSRPTPHASRPTIEPSTVHGPRSTDEEPERPQSEHEWEEVDALPPGYVHFESEDAEEEDFDRSSHSRGRGRNGPRRRDRRNGAPRSDRDRRPKPLIQDIFRRGQEVLVQVIKEGVGTKGPTLSTYISIAGRYLVLMPGLNRVGVSRKIADEEQRRRLRQIFQELKPPKGLGFIIRTAGMDKTKKELQRDLAYLSRLWQVVARRIRKSKSPAEIYQESDMITRTIRDIFTSDIDTIWVDEPHAFEHAQEFLHFVLPRYANRIKLYSGNEPLFHKYGLEDEIARIHQKKVPLPGGGSIVLEQTEALVAIDVNSGNFRCDQGAEETAYQMNLLAAREIARQLRLRDLGGVIVNDFIDMREEKHRRGVEKALRDAVKRDRARTKVLKMSAFGIIEMTRQRIRPSLGRSVYDNCLHCNARGQVKTPESMSIEVMRMLQLASCRDYIARVDVHVTETVGNYLLNRKRRELTQLEQTGNMNIHIYGQPGRAPEHLDLLCFDKNGNEVKLYPVATPQRRR